MTSIDRNISINTDRLAFVHLQLVSAQATVCVIEAGLVWRAIYESRHVLMQDALVESSIGTPENSYSHLFL
jgi:hypothetical protein